MRAEKPERGGRAKNNKIISIKIFFLKGANMAGIALIISILALVVAYLAYTKSGGSLDDLKQKVDDIHLTTEALRSKVADSLEKIEKKVRGEQQDPRG